MANLGQTEAALCSRFDRKAWRRGVATGTVHGVPHLLRQTGPTCAELNHPKLASPARSAQLRLRGRSR